MTDTTNPGDGEAMSEVVDAAASDDADLTLNQDNQDPDNADDDPEGGEDDPDAEDEVDLDGDKLVVPKAIAAKLKALQEGNLRHADYTRKTQEIADTRKDYEGRLAVVQKTAVQQQEFVQDIAALGALNAKLEPYKAVTDWPAYLRTGGPEAQAHYAEFTALQQEQRSFAQNLTGKIQQREAEEQRETAKQIEAGRAEIAKHITGYSPETLSKLEQFAAPFGFSSDEIRQAEADPRSIRILHLAHLGQQALDQKKRTSTIAAAQKTKPVQTLRGAGGRIAPRPDTDDFAAFERLVDERAKAKLRR